MTDTFPAPSRLLLATGLIAKWALRLVAGGWLLLALVWVALHFVIVPRIDALRPWLEEQASRTLGTVVRIGSISAQSNGLIPSVELRGVQVLDAQGQALGAEAPCPTGALLWYWRHLPPEPRVPFGQVVERGMLRPGEVLTSPRGKTARVRADGTLVGPEMTGSIHQVGAAMEGAPSCNGWTYWHFRRDGQMVPIDILRQQIRAEMVDGQTH